METGELLPAVEEEPRAKTIGILLTAGSQEKTRGGYRIEPDLEGKVRALGALDDLAHRQIDRLFVVGGQQSQDRPVSEHYKRFLKRFINRYNLDEQAIEDLPGGVDTGSDLKKAAEELRNMGLDHSLRIYSTSFHLKRASTVMKSLGYKVETISTEDLTKSRSKRHPKVVDSIITPEFLKRMNDREKRILRILRLDTLPVIGKLHAGLKIAEVIARRRRNN